MHDSGEEVGSTKINSDAKTPLAYSDQVIAHSSVGDESDNIAGKVANEGANGSVQEETNVDVSMDATGDPLPSARPASVVSAMQVMAA